MLVLTVSFAYLLHKSHTDITVGIWPIPYYHMVLF